MNIRIRLIALLLLTSSFLVYGQIFNYQSLDMESGLSNNSIRTIFKDSQGLMWFGTGTDLDSYDGQQIISYAKRFNTPIKGAIQSIVEIPKGQFILGTNWGGYQYEIKKNTVTAIDFGIPSIDVRYVLKSSKETIFFCTDKGLYTLSSPSLKPKPFQLKNNISFSLYSLAEDKSGDIWIGGDDALFKITAKSQVMVQPGIASVCGTIKVILPINNILFLGTNKGLFAYNTKLQQLRPIVGFEGVSVLSLTFDHDTNLYVGTSKAGVGKVNVNTLAVEYFKHDPSNPKSIFSNTITSIFFDKSKVLWLGSFDKGVEFLNLQNNRKFNTLDLNSNIRSLYITTKGDKYIGTSDGYLICLDSNNKFKSKIIPTTGHSLRSKTLTTIFPYPGEPNFLLIGTFGGGIYLLNTKTNTLSNFSKDKVFQNCSTYKFCTDKENQLWITTLDGLYRYNTQNHTYVGYNISKVTGSNEIFTLCSDNKDKIWIGTKTGVCYYSQTNKKFIQPVSSKQYRFQSTSSFIDKKGNIWFSFDKGGVLMLGKDLSQKLWLTTEIDMPGNSPISLIEDNESNVWIGTLKGLYKVNSNYEIHNYGLEDGLNSLGFTPECCASAPNGDLWWGNGGLVTFINDKNTLNNQIPRLKLTDLFINGTKYDSDTLSFVNKVSDIKYTIFIKGKNNNNLEFRVAALNYKNSKRNQYSFWLSDVDKGWTKASTIPIMSYNKLSPGIYILKIKASNNDGVWSTTPTEITFTISPYFYETTWFIALIWILILGVFIYFTRTYIIRMKTKVVAQFEEIKKKQTATSNYPTMSEKKCQEIIDRLTTYMEEQKPYLNSELRQVDVVVFLGYSVREVSQVLNTKLNQNFSDFVNSYRVEEVKIRIQNNELDKYTLTAIALKCGFSAKSSFLRAFKKATNMTPTDYFKGIKDE